MGAGSAGAFGARMVAHLEEVEERNDEALDRVADRLLAAVRADLRIHAAGTGHSSALVLETFYRAGGLACVNPIVHPGLVPLAGAIASTALERRADLAEPLLAQAAPVEGETAIVFSSSGANPLPVALARGLRDAGVGVVAMCSLPQLRAAPARGEGKLDEVADELLDTGVPVGDAAYVDGRAATAALSGLTATFLWNLVLARLTDLASAAGIELPVWTSANTPGGDERNAHLLTRYRPRIPLL